MKYELDKKRALKFGDKLGGGRSEDPYLAV